MDDAWEETETSRVIREAAEARQKIVKITIRAERADGTVSEMEAVEPESVRFFHDQPYRDLAWSGEAGMGALLETVRRYVDGNPQLTVAIKPGIARWSAAIRPPGR